MVDYYKILGVARNATKSDIKKAFHKLSLKYHPDKYEGPESKDKVMERYQAMKTAYETLSDPDKRQMYDKFGADYDKYQGGPNPFANARGGGGNPFGPGGPTMGANFTNLFEQMFRNNGMNPGNMRRPPPGEQRENQDITHTVRLSFAEAYTGIKREVNIRKKTKCKSCNGRGTVSTEYIDECNKCNGQGMYSETRRINAHTVQQTQRTCDQCKGRGSKIREGRECQQCKARRYLINSEPTEITIPPGVDDDFHLQFDGHGHTMYEKPGNLIIVVKVGKPPRNWDRAHNTLKVDYRISLRDAMCGFKKVLRHLDGRELLLIHEGVMQPETTKKIAGEGFKDVRTGKPGDLFVKFIVELPRSFDTAKLKESLPPQESVITHNAMKRVNLS